jgi:hypothetical protein
MGQQQLLLIILGVIIVGIAIAVGLQLFQAGSIGANQDAIINDVMNIAAHADQWRIRPVSMGGGNGKFTASIGSQLNENQRLMETANGTYSVTVVAGTETTTGTITITGVSTGGYGNVVLTYNPDAAEDVDRYDWSASNHDGGIGQ